MKLKVIYNPTAGRGRTRKQMEHVLARLSAGASLDVHASSSPEDLTRVAAESSGGDYDRVVVCGGDGTVHLAIQQFDLDRGTLAIIPLGSGDDFARVAEVPRSIDNACDAVLHGKTRNVDIALANDSRFVCIAGLGFDSEVTSYANEKAPRFLRGSAVYLYSILRVLPNFTPHRIRMTVDGVETPRSIMMTVVGNAPHYGGGIHIVPDAKIDDGLLDYCIVTEATRLELLKTLPGAYKGTHVNSPFVQIGRAREIRIESERPMDVYADGERATKTPVTFSLEEKKLRLTVPSPREAGRGPG